MRRLVIAAAALVAAAGITGVAIAITGGGPVTPNPGPSFRAVGLT